jgi:hypothetical protein
MLTSFFHSILSATVLRRQGAATGLLVRLAPHPTDPLEAIDNDLGTAIARMLALTDDPRTPPETAALWRQLIESAVSMRGKLREKMAE